LWHVDGGGHRGVVEGGVGLGAVVDGGGGGECVRGQVGYDRPVVEVACVD